MLSPVDLFTGNVENNITQYKPRSAISGRFVREYVLEKYPNTTYLDKITFPSHRTK